jgi:hypothetical protein
MPREACMRGGHRRRLDVRSFKNEATQPCCPVVRENEYFQPFRYNNLIDAFGLRVLLYIAYVLVVSTTAFSTNVECAVDARNSGDTTHGADFYKIASG